MKSNHIQYTSENGLFKIFLALSCIWPFFGGGILLSIMKSRESGVDQNAFFAFCILCPIIEVTFLALYFLLRSRSRKEDMDREQICQEGKKTVGRICRVQVHDTDPDSRGRKYHVQKYFAEVEFYNEYTGSYISKKTEALQGIPFGKANYQIESSNRYDTFFVPVTELKCTVYYCKDGRFFVK